jgi:hypothetical protein
LNRWALVPGCSTGYKLCQEEEIEVLTRDGGGGTEGCSHLRLELNHGVLLDLGVAELDLLLDPGCEGLADDSVEHVDDILQERKGQHEVAEGERLGRHNSFRESVLATGRSRTYLPGELLELMLDREVLLHHRGVVMVDPLQDLGDSQVLVEGHGQVADLVSLEPALLAACLVTEVPDRHSLDRRLVGLAVDGEEVVDLALGLVLGGELRH